MTEPKFIASADGMECLLTGYHCVTNDSSACPQLTPLPPNWCANGRIETTPRFIASADGKECSVPDHHCVTSDASLCP